MANGDEVQYYASRYARGGYGGGGNTGAIYYHALSGLGDDIARAMQQYHQQHQMYDQQYGISDALSRLGVNQQGVIVPIQLDEKGKQLDKTVRPIIDPQALQMFQARTANDRARATGALHAINDLGTKQINRILQQTLQDQGLTGRLKAQRIKQSQSRTTLTDLQILQALGMIPQRVKPPTSNEVMKEMRAQRAERMKQQTNIANMLSNNDVQDPNLLLKGFTFSRPGDKTMGLFPTTYQDKPRYDENGNVIVPPDATGVKLGNKDQTELSVDDFNRLYPQAKQWQELGKVPKQLLPPAHDMQTLLQNPTDMRQQQFDSHYGQGAAAAVLSAGGQQQQQPTPTPTPAPETAEDYDTSGEEPPPDTSDAGSADTGE